MKRSIRKIWRMLPPAIRLQIVRTTQRKFTVSAAALIRNDSGEVLLLNHVLRPLSGWGLPGGFVDKGEQPEETIRREVMEETGIRLADLSMLRVRTVNKHIEVLFTAVAAGEPSVMSREIFELGWFSPGRLPDEMSTAQKTIIKEVFGAVN